MKRRTDTIEYQTRTRAIALAHRLLPDPKFADVDQCAEFLARTRREAMEDAANICDMLGLHSTAATEIRKLKDMP